MTNDDIIIYHNPDCGNSRKALDLIRRSGIEPHIIEYLKTPPSRALLKRLVARMGITTRALLREKDTPIHEFGLDDPTIDDEVLLDAMQANPAFINRPIVVSSAGVRLCRPAEQVLELLSR